VSEWETALEIMTPTASSRLANELEQSIIWSDVEEIGNVGQKVVGEGL
jgi:hypothetical protein